MGMFGAFGRGFRQAAGRFASNPDNWRMVGAGLRDLSDGGNRLDGTIQQMHDNRRQAQMDAMAQQQFGWKGEEMDQQRAQWRQAEEQRRQLEALIASLSAEEQVSARLDPEGFVRARLTPQSKSLMEVSPGATLYDPRTGQSVFRAPPNPLASDRQPPSQLPPGWSEY